jgi:hypothetical protein
VSIELTVSAEGATSRVFATHHGVPVPSSGARLRLGDDFAGGAFGAIHSVEQLDGKQPPKPIVAKVFAPGRLTAGRTEEVASTNQLHTALEADGGACWPDAMLGLLYSLFHARVNGRDTLVGLMLDLRPLGYGPAPFAEGQPKRAYRKRPVQERIELALRFAERAALLERIRFVHGDMNEQNLLVDPTRPDVQIIDFDAGAIVTRGDEHPRTPGKPDGCMPPEVKTAGAGSNFDLDKFTLEAERWSVAMLMGYFLFGFLPTFFLNRISGPVVDEYGRKHRWPDIDTAGPLFTAIEDNKKLYRVLKRELGSFPEGARECFERLFAAGLDGSKRPTGGEWVAGLESLKDPPKILVLDVDETIVFEGTAVEVTWNVRNATSVELTPGPGGRLPASGSTKVVLESSTIFEIRASNDYGESHDYGAVVRVLPIPRLEFVPVPTAPSLSFPTSIPIVSLGPGPAGASWLSIVRAALADVGPGVDVVPPAPPAAALLRTHPPSELPPPAPDARELLKTPLIGAP